MEQHKVYLLLKVKVPLKSVKEFNDFWVKESLPIWIKHGAKHIGSFTNYVGGPTDEIIRLFEFESIAQWDQWYKFINEDERGKALYTSLKKYLISVERRLLRAL